MAPFISICIPAYKRTNYLQRLLESIAIQSYTDFEVIVSDDSPDDSVQRLIAKYSFPIIYYSNPKPLGTPANWNFAISHARGAWIKLVHDDDWFATPGALAAFADKAKPGKKFIFSAYTNVYDDGRKEAMFINTWKELILKEPGVLLARNIIGPPSVTMLHSSIIERYDERLKWRVDMEFYIRVLSLEQAYTYINQPLINVGISDSQVTQSCIYVPEVELPEGLLLLQKHGLNPLRNIWVYDAWWRLLRNMNIRSAGQLQSYAQVWPSVINRMVHHLNLVPASMLKIGALSKVFMFLSFSINKPNRRQ